MQMSSVVQYWLSVLLKQKWLVSRTLTRYRVSGRIAQWSVTCVVM